MGPAHGAPVHPPCDRVVLCQAHLCSEHPWCSAEAEPASRWDEIPRPKPRSGLHIALDEVALRFWAVAKTRRAKLFSPQRLCVLRGDGAADPAERLREAVREEKMGEKPLLCTHPPPGLRYSATVRPATLGRDCLFACHSEAGALACLLSRTSHHQRHSMPAG
ncbi:hypothetical protein LDHU3_36.3340:CDS1 [Leishmania donovani]|uniref:Hypothetical_protein n=1 Tax=Leishmania donovani TaxID=5661 RepID=A0A6J8FPX5_LEIDO|nr:hypothetical protein LDHU3_36.3340:CDS1 [Leishmania donovani]VDZ49437.1 hypothetical_protein [Leishmania donovani]